MEVLSLESVFVYIILQNREEKQLCVTHFKSMQLSVKSRYAFFVLVSFFF